GWAGPALPRRRYFRLLTARAAHRRRRSTDPIHRSVAFRRAGARQLEGCPETRSLGMTSRPDSARRPAPACGNAPSSRKEPIAIIGIGCRLPSGVSGPESFWQLLRDGIDAIREVPPDRWSPSAFFDADPGRPGKIAGCWGGFLDLIDQFDAPY